MNIGMWIQRLTTNVGIRRILWDGGKYLFIYSDGVSYAFTVSEAIHFMTAYSIGLCSKPTNADKFKET
jgi:hypothetical protein